MHGGRECNGPQAVSLSQHSPTYWIKRLWSQKVLCLSSDFAFYTLGALRHSGHLCSCFFTYKMDIIPSSLIVMKMIYLWDTKCKVLKLVPRP